MSANNRVYYIYNFSSVYLQQCVGLPNKCSRLLEKTIHILSQGVRKGLTQPEAQLTTFTKPIR